MISKLTDAIRAGQTYGNLEISEISLVNRIAVGSNYSSELSITGSRRGDVYGTKNFIERVRFYYTVNGSGHIEECLSGQISGAATCIALNGEWTGTNCNFCPAIGGTNEGGVCVVGTPPSTPTVPPTAPPPSDPPPNNPPPATVAHNCCCMTHSTYGPIPGPSSCFNTPTKSACESLGGPLNVGGNEGSLEASWIQICQWNGN